MTHRKRKNKSSQIKITSDQEIHCNDLLSEVKASYDIELPPLAEKAFAHQLFLSVDDEPLAELSQIMLNVKTIVSCMVESPDKRVDLYRNFLSLHKRFDLVHDMAWYQHLDHQK